MLPKIEPEWRRRRRLLGMNQTEFWSRVAVEQSVGSRYEGGRPLPPPVRLLLELAFGNDLLAGEIFRTLRANAADSPLTNVDAVRDYRQARGLSLARFWSVLGVARSVASRYENGRRLPRQVQMLLKLAYASPWMAWNVYAGLRGDDRSRLLATPATERRRSSDRRQVDLPLPPGLVDRRSRPDRRLGC